MSDRQLSATGKRYAIATPHRAATEAGVAAFEDGGNAVDAALAAAIVLAVVYPHMCGVGGDLFALVQALNGQTIALNASGAAPIAIDVDAIRDAGDTMPEYGPLTITVPGAVSGWAALAKLGADLAFERAFQPAIAHARDGVPVASSLQSGLAWEPSRLFADPGMREVFARDNTPLAEGDMLVQPALAATLEAVAGEGPSALYGGEVGARLVAELRAIGSPMSLQDLADHRAELDSPIAARYRDLHVSVVPPNS
ncbi:MAG: gamma-glutamyltransferase, partial [Candidatus Rokuibacteriota bacterium]